VLNPDDALEASRLLALKWMRDNGKALVHE